MTISISWTHGAASAPAFAPLIPKAIDAIERWAYVEGRLQTDEFGPYYDVITRGIKTDVYHKVLRPATLRLGAMKALQDAPEHVPGWYDAIDEIFTNVIAETGSVHNPDRWADRTLDFMVQLAWFREVMFA
jgi:hypothetical protein